MNILDIEDTPEYSNFIRIKETSKESYESVINGAKSLLYLQNTCKKRRKNKTLSALVKKHEETGGKVLELTRWPLPDPPSSRNNGRPGKSQWCSFCRDHKLTGHRYKAKKCNRCACCAHAYGFITNVLGMDEGDYQCITRIYGRTVKGTKPQCARRYNEGGVEIKRRKIN